MPDEYDQSGEWQDPEFQEQEFQAVEKPARFSSKMPMSNSERQKAWRERHPEHKEYMRQYMADRRKK